MKDDSDSRLVEKDANFIATGGQNDVLEKDEERLANERHAQS